MTEKLHRPETFAPDAETQKDFRNALGRFGTGVTVITCMTDEGPLGITANSFASLSLDPPLVLWSPGKFSRRYGAFTAARHFAIHVAGADQLPLCEGFAKDADFFHSVDWEENAQGVPVLDGWLARFECDKVAQHDGGDHAIVVGHVTRVQTRPGAPLVFFEGRYGSFEEPQG